MMCPLHQNGSSQTKKEKKGVVYTRLVWGGTFSQTATILYGIQFLTPFSNFRNKPFYSFFFFALEKPPFSAPNSCYDDVGTLASMRRYLADPEWHFNFNPKATRIENIQNLNKVKTGIFWVWFKFAFQLSVSRMYFKTKARAHTYHC